MRRRDFLKSTAAGGAALLLAPSAGRLLTAEHGPSRISFNRDWRFFRGEDPAGAAWEPVTLPHTARIEALVTGEPGSPTYQWQGLCWYEKRFVVGPETAGKKVYLLFDGAMNVADVWLDGEHLGRHLGGYLPFGFDLTGRLVPGYEHVLTVRLDNTDNPITGPKPLHQLDFNLYHGIYRDVHLIVKDPLHITDPILADKTASGGVFVRYPEVTPEAALVWVQVHVRNDDAGARRFVVEYVLEDEAGAVVAGATSDPVTLAPGQDTEVVRTLQVLGPALWSPRSPSRYTLRTRLVEHGAVVDEEVTRIGIRRIEISAEGFRINGEKMFLRGTNRHQEYPYVGYAVPDAAQYRDARKIKEAGFDYIRLSHYPHDPSFMEACDELGLVVMNCIPGWQYFNRDDPRFAEIQYENCRRLIRRDRNHPCVILWEVSLNETWMPPEFVAKTQAIAHEEYPGDQMYTCGWTDGYDVFIQARQHGGCVEVTDRPCVVSEYGDWEYYAQNAGLNQEAWADLAPDEANSRQLRWHGERALLQQATNFQEAHNDNRKTIAFADGLWVMFDYNRGYAPDIESSGCMDLFRLPKFSYHFFRSQRDAAERYPGLASGPMVFIASYWTPDSPTDVRVFSNCDEVALSVGGRLVARQRPDADRLSTHLAHPPFTFRLERFEPGLLEAVGYLDGRPAARHAVRTPGRPARLSVWVDEGGRPFARDGKDVVFVHAALQDEHGTVVPDAWENVFFGTIGGVSLVGANPLSSDAGIASVLVQAERRPRAAVYALAIVREGGLVRLLGGAAPLGGDVLPWEIRYATGGHRPGPRAPRYDGAFQAGEPVQAALFVNGHPVVQADETVPKFRIAGSVAPPDRNG